MSGTSRTGGIPALPAARVNSFFILKRLHPARVFRFLRFAGRRIFLKYSACQFLIFRGCPVCVIFEVFLSPQHLGHKSHFSGMRAEPPGPEFSASSCTLVNTPTRALSRILPKRSVLKNYHLLYAFRDALCFFEVSISPFLSMFLPERRIRKTHMTTTYTQRPDAAPRKRAAKKWAAFALAMGTAFAAAPLIPSTPASAAIGTHDVSSSD